MVYEGKEIFEDTRYCNFTKLGSTLNANRSSSVVLSFHDKQEDPILVTFGIVNSRYQG
jgi:hypothetical protein